MLKIPYSNQTHWQFETLNTYLNLTHLVTGSNLHINRGNILGLNYGLNVSDQEEIVQNNRSELLVQLHFNPATTVFPIQTHSNNVAIVTDDNKHSIFQNTDALITNTPSILIGVLSADCVPILLFDPKKRVVAAIHAGWKGTVAEIVSCTIKKMMLEFNCTPDTIIAAIGPSISSENFEVGEEVSIQFKDACKHMGPNGKMHIDICLANKLQLLEIGVKESNISLSGLCTFKNNVDFYSARRDGFNTGRLASVIGLTV
ncbi:peptidoglycan editing factor PgeF [uncultured Cytophaga sp.]|uniref:peptidoglycan editing factor PgeF n=1 Tax=uncultured Cytophaga sp. TaxID=160238 RepID=UPI0026250E3B|nr:peptidoglycan editing factor PgeF [uncultured Cytophaga sp.]